MLDKSLSHMLCDIIGLSIQSSKAMHVTSHSSKGALHILQVISRLCKYVLAQKQRGEGEIKGTAVSKVLHENIQAKCCHAYCSQHSNRYLSRYGY